MHLNKVLIAGNITREPELKQAGSTELVSFSLAINEKIKSQSGDYKDKTTFVEVTCFGKMASVINQYFTKGSPIFIEGKLDFQQWEKDGKKFSKLKVIGQNFQFVGSNKDRQSVSPAQRPDIPEQDIPF